MSAAAEWLSLAATPCFALMAVVTAVSGGPAEILCTAATPIGGMVPMYLLMSIFHAVPWVKLIARRREMDKPAA